MKEILKSTLVYFLIGATVTGSVYKLIDNTNDESIFKLIMINLTLVLIAFVFSYYGNIYQR